MSEFLGEPTEALKQELRHLIDDNIPESQNMACFSLSENVEIGISRPDYQEPEEEQYYSVELVEEVHGSDDTNYQNTYYYLFNDGRLKKKIEDDEAIDRLVDTIDTQFTPKEQARIDQEGKRMDEGVKARVMLGMDEQAAIKEGMDEFMDRNPHIMALVNQRMVETLHVIGAVDQAESELGLTEVNAVELQEVIETIRAAIAKNIGTQ